MCFKHTKRKGCKRKLDQLNDNTLNIYLHWAITSFLKLNKQKWVFT